MWIRLGTRAIQKSEAARRKRSSVSQAAGGAGRSHPAFPPASIWLASVTSLDQTSNCHLRRPSTPQCTRPLWMPTRMFTLTPVTSLTSLQMRIHTLLFKKKTLTNISWWFLCFSALVSNVHSRNGFNHVYSHLHTAVGMISPGLGQTRYTVVTVSEDFDAQAVVLLLNKGAKYRFHLRCWFFMRPNVQLAVLWLKALWICSAFSFVSHLNVSDRHTNFNFKDNLEKKTCLLR